MADLLDQMAQGLVDGAALDASGEWLARARALAGEIRRVDSGLGQAEESVRLYPRRLLVPGVGISLQRTLEIMERAALTVRGLARSVADSSRLEADYSPLRDTDIRTGLAMVLRELAEAVRIYGRLARMHDTAGLGRPGSELDRHPAGARERQGQHPPRARPAPPAPPGRWRCRAGAAGGARSEGGRVGAARRGKSRSGPPVSGRGPLKLSYPRRSQLDSPVESSAGRLAGRSLLSSQENDRGVC